MDLTRLDGPDGAWATFRQTYGWGPDIRIQATLIDGDGSEAFMRALVRETVLGIHAPKDGGGWVDWSRSDEQPFFTDGQMDVIDSRFGDQVLLRCRSIWGRWRKGRPDPKDTTEPSPDTPPDGA